ncbi:MAG: hypothetical protein L3J06_10530 [Cyclobacteriaceae bacterium]|nr:hypothetical protein [Cyclobacteriaceae bacterium]
MVEIDERSIPDTVANNEYIKINVKASAVNLCWGDLYVELKENKPFEYDVKAYGTFTCCDKCACPTAMLYMDTIIDFQPTQKGLYLFHVSELQSKITTDTMVVR